MSEAEDARLMAEVTEMLAAGLKTEVEPFPETQKEFGEVLDRLRAVDKNDVKSKLVISGYINHPYGAEKMRCMECIYYLVHRKWCDLPEISLPAEPDWYCKLWRI
jgi:hypothetical protein